jgi:hypothetical protein
LRPVLLLPEDLLPEELLPEDLVPEDLLELLLVVVLPLDPEGLLFFLAPLSVFERLLVLLLSELPLSIFRSLFVERADVPDVVADFFLAAGLLRSLLVFPCFVSLVV